MPGGIHLPGWVGLLRERRRTGLRVESLTPWQSSVSAGIHCCTNPYHAERNGVNSIWHPAAAHELRFPDPREAFIFDREVVVFWGQDGETRTECAISQKALDDHFNGDDEDKLEVFRANRQAIEEEARKKYLGGATEPDGSVLIRTLDLAG